MNTQDLADRLTRLERENRRLKRIGAVVLIGIVAVVVMGQAKRPEVHDVLAAKRFVLRGDQGKQRAMLAVNGGTASLILLGGDGQPVASLNAKEDAEALVLVGRRNGGHLSLHSDADSTEIILVNDGRENGYRAFVGAGPDGSGFSLSNGAGEIQAAMEISDRLTDHIYLRDKKGELVFRAPK